MWVVQAVHEYDVWLPRPKCNHGGVNPLLHCTEKRHIPDIDASAIGRSIDLVEKRHVGNR
jgi:hypothetical protein